MGMFLANLLVIAENWNQLKSPVAGCTPIYRSYSAIK
jgi:hypothetical protein